MIMRERKSYVEPRYHVVKEASQVGYWTKAAGILKITRIQTIILNNKWMLQYQEYLDTVQGTMDIISSSLHSQLIIHSSTLKMSTLNVREKKKKGSVS